MEMIALMPARRPAMSSSGAKQKRSGMRCTTFTQLPLAFCGGRIANCAPVPGAIEQTEPRHSRDGKVSMVTLAGKPTPT